MNFLFVLAQLETTAVREKAWRKMYFASYAVLAAFLFTSLTENLRLCFSAEARLFLICS